MTYKRFEDLPVWRAAIAFAGHVFDLLEDASFAGQGDIRSQLLRAGLSISNNIAEGFERGTTADLLNFLYISRGSAGESRSMLRFVERRPRWAHLQERIVGLIDEAEQISKQLRGWADSLQNSEIKGQRHLNAETKNRFQQETRTVAFVDKLKRIQNGEKVEDVLGASVEKEQDQDGMI